MRRSLAALVLLATLLGLSAGCARLRGMTPGWFAGTCRNCPEDCAACEPACPGGGCGLLGGRGQEAFTPGPPTGTVTYPYYTVRGPRDFLAEDPRGIGP
jgi:hypothetical protein